MQQGFKTVESWPGCFTHVSLKVLLTVYVDDFKMAGSASDLDKAWDCISRAVKIEEPVPFGRYLGCEHILGTTRLTNAEDIIGRSLAGIAPAEGCARTLPVEVRSMTYDVRQFMKACVEEYLRLSERPSSSLSKVSTPFLDESTAWAPPDGPATGRLADCALRVLMKVLDGARMARPDLLRTSHKQWTAPRTESFPET